MYKEAFQPINAEIHNVTIGPKFLVWLSDI